MSGVLNITLFSMLQAQLQRVFPFTLKSDFITYLGTHIPSKLLDLYQLNDLRILDDISKDLPHWKAQKIS